MSMVPRWSPDIIMEEVGSWSTYYNNAYGHGESKMEFIIVMEEVGCWLTY